MSGAPVLIDNRKFLSMSVLDNCIVYEIRKEPKDDHAAPFLDEIDQLQNLGIICNLEVDKDKKSLLVHSFKDKQSLSYFQKGIVLPEYSSTPQLTKIVQNFTKICGEGFTAILVSFRNLTRCYILQRGFEWIQD